MTRPDEFDPTLPIARDPWSGGHGPALDPGELVAERYRILSFVARGGSGEVYRAEDLELGGEVALKTLALAEASDAIKLERFRREIHLARKVTHPNVCRIYDFGRHRREATERDRALDTLFLTMEFLDGETLASHLSNGGRLEPQEALPWARQMADALDAAHRAAIIHRDFKSSNVLLVADPREASGFRVVVTDFGLARAGISMDDPRGTVTSSGLIVGTPSYMAPEQVEGTPISTAVDIYAFGVVLYEMITGDLPFHGDSALSIAVKRLREPPIPPRRVVPGLDPHWEAVVLRCLEREPARRFPSAGAAVDALAGGASLSTSSEAAGRRRILQRGIAASMVVASLLAGLWLARRDSPSSSVPADRGGLFATGASPGAAVSRPSVAVLGFRNLTGQADAAWLGVALAEMLSTEMAAGGALRTVPGETISRFRADANLEDVDELAAPTLRRVRASLGTDLLVLGSYVLQGDTGASRLRFDVRLQDTSLGETVRVLGREGRLEDLFDLVAEIGRELRAAVGAGASAEDERRVRSALPRDPEATRLYADGLLRLRLSDPAGARERLAEAIARDPEHALAHSAISEAWSRLGYDRLAGQAAARAFELSGDLPRAERLLIEARHRRAAAEWPRALELLHSLWTFFPDDIEHGLRLAEAQTLAGQPAEALATVATLDRLPQGLSDPRVALAEAEAAMRISDHQRHLASSERALRLGEELGSGRAIAAGHLQKGKALRALGRLDDAAAAIDSAARSFDDLGDREGYADALRFSAILERSRGNAERALDTAQVALAVLRSIGNQAGVAAVLNTIGNIDYQQGRLADATTRYEEALAIGRQIGDPHGVARTLGNLANTLFLRGDLARAATAHQEALAVKIEIGDRNGAAVTRIGLASIELERGELPVAERLFAAARREAAETESASVEAHALFGLGQVAFEGARWDDAAAAYHESLAIRQRIGESLEIAESRLALAVLHLATNRPSEAVQGALRAASEFELQGATDSEAMARVVLAEGLRAENRRDEARAAVERAVELAPAVEFVGQRLTIQAHAARVLAMLADTQSAQRLAEAADRQAREGGLVRARLETRFGLATAAAAAGSAPPAAELMGLADECESLGFARLAARVRTLPADSSR